VAVKRLAASSLQGAESLWREVEVLSRVRHPHIVLLLGACPEGGCLVYELMEVREAE
jgi:serine/threonine protein kinase